MFAKVFGQIFDSSIAEDYNCRRMFMDLLVLSDSDGVVDMTPEAISRRTNVPMEEVTKYISELCQPDPLSRSKLHEGKRLIPSDSNRGWGWQIVNYGHYREIRDEEARRTYFRDYQRVRRKREKSKSVKDINLTEVSEGEQKFSPASSSASSSASSLQKGESEGKGRCNQKEAEDFCESLRLPRSDGTAMFLHWEEKGWAKVRDWKLTIRKWQSFGYLPSQKHSKFSPKAEWSKMTWPRDWQEAKRQVRFLETKVKEFPEAADRIAALEAQFKL